MMFFSDLAIEDLYAVVKKLQREILWLRRTVVAIILVLLTVALKLAVWG